MTEVNALCLLHDLDEPRRVARPARRLARRRPRGARGRSGDRARPARGPGGRAVVPRAARHARLLQEARGDGARPSRPTAGSGRATSPCATPRDAPSSRAGSARCCASATSWWRPARSRPSCMTHPTVLQAFVVGVPDPRTNEAAVAYVIPRPGARAHARTRSSPTAGATSPPSRCRATSASWTTSRARRARTATRCRRASCARCSSPSAGSGGRPDAVGVYPRRGLVLVHQDHLGLDGEREQAPARVGDARLPDPSALAPMQRRRLRAHDALAPGGEEIGLGLERVVLAPAGRSSTVAVAPTVSASAISVPRCSRRRRCGCRPG